MMCSIRHWPLCQHPWKGWLGERWGGKGEGGRGPAPDTMDGERRICRSERPLAAGAPAALACGPVRPQLLGGGFQGRPALELQDAAIAALPACRASIRCDAKRSTQIEVDLTHLLSPPSPDLD